jgi:hypothetical protein
MMTEIMSSFSFKKEISWLQEETVAVRNAAELLKETGRESIAIQEVNTSAFGVERRNVRS